MLRSVNQKSPQLIGEHPSVLAWAGGSPKNCLSGASFFLEGVFVFPNSLRENKNARLCKLAPLKQCTAGPPAQTSTRLILGTQFRI